MGMRSGVVSDNVAKYKSHPPAFLRSDVFIFCHGLPPIGEIATCRRLAPSYSPLFTPLLILTSATAFSWVKDFCPCSGVQRGEEPLCKEKAVVTHKSETCFTSIAVCV